MTKQESQFSDLNPLVASDKDSTISDGTELRQPMAPAMCAANIIVENFVLIHPFRTFQCRSVFKEVGTRVNVPRKKSSVNFLSFPRILTLPFREIQQ
jgi:hypothetical protein